MTKFTSKKEIIKQRTKTRLKNESLKREKIINNAQKEISAKSLDLKSLGTALYWAEGGKTNRGLVRFSNSDPDMIKVMMKFFREICDVKETKFRGYIHAYKNSDVKALLNYWSKITGIDKNQFFKTHQQKPISSKGTKNNLPFGTLEVYICDTNLFLRIKGWTKGIINNT